jgi:hypothetical protein
MFSFTADRTDTAAAGSLSGTADRTVAVAGRADER